VSWDQVTASSLASKSAAVRFVADNPQGDNHDVYIPTATVKPSGNMDFIGTDWMNGQLAVEALKPSSGAAVYIDGRPVA
jgi:hypothetical protein